MDQRPEGSFYKDKFADQQDAAYTESTRHTEEVSGHAGEELQLLVAPRG